MRLFGWEVCKTFWVIWGIHDGCLSIRGNFYTRKNNKIYLVLKGKKKELRRKFKGLNIEITGNNNIITLHLPVYFEDTNIEIDFEKFTKSIYEINDLGIKVNNDNYKVAILENRKIINLIQPLIKIRKENR